MPLKVLLLLLFFGQEAWAQYSYGWAPSDKLEAATPIPAEWRGTGAGQTRKLYLDYEQVARHAYVPRNQGRAPSCVGQSMAAAIDILAGVQGFQVRVDASTVYGFSRQEVGQLGPLAGGGSHCAWACRAVNEYGVLFQEPYFVADLSEPSPERCVEYGKTGVPDGLEPAAALSLVAQYYAVNSYEELRDTIWQGCPVVIGSNVGFGSRDEMTRDRDGFLNRPRRGQGRVWMHAMVVVAVADTGREGALILNSWGGEWIVGPQRFEDEPLGTFWVDASIIDTMTAQGDAFAIQGFQYMTPFWGIER